MIPRHWIIGIAVMLAVALGMSVYAWTMRSRVKQTESPAEYAQPVAAPVQVSVYITAPEVVGVTDWEPVAAWPPLHAPLAVQETAWVLDQVKVADWPAVIDVGLTDRVTVGVGAGGAADPLPPQACSARAMTAPAAAGKGFRVRKLVKIGDMFPGPSGVLAAQALELQHGDVPTGAFPKVWNRARDFDAEREFTHRQTRAARALFHYPVEFLGQTCGGDPLALVELVRKRVAAGKGNSESRTHTCVRFDADSLGQAPHRDVQIAPLIFGARV